MAGIVNKVYCDISRPYWYHEEAKFAISSLSHEFPAQWKPSLFTASATDEPKIIKANVSSFCVSGACCF